MIYILCILCLSNTAILHTFDCMVEYMVQYVDHWFTVTHYSYTLQWCTMIYSVMYIWTSIQYYSSIQWYSGWYWVLCTYSNTTEYNDIHWHTMIYIDTQHSDTNKHIHSDTRRNWYAMRWVASIQRKPLPGLILHSAFFFIIVIISNTTIIITINSSFTLLSAILADKYGFR